MKYTIILVLSIISVKVYSQDSLTFRYFLKIGLQNNYSIQIVRNNEVMSKNNVTLGNAGMLPTIDASSRYSEQYVLNSRTERISTNDTVKAVPIIKSNVRTTNLTSGVNLNWNIFDGFQMFIEYRRLNELQKLGELNTRMTVENLISDIGTECFSYIQLKKRLQTLQYVMIISKERLNVARERYLIGNLSKLEYQQATVDFNTDSTNYMNQQLLLIGSRSNLNNILAIDPMAQTDVSDSIVVDTTLEYNNLMESTIAKNTSLMIASKNQALSEMDLRLINSRIYPVLSLTGGYTYSKSTDPSSIMVARQTNGVNYGLSLSINLFNGWDLSRQRANARIAIKNSELQYKAVEQDIKSQLSLIYSLYQNALKVVSLQNSNLRTASDNFRIGMERYRLGQLSGLEIRDIQRAYLDAEDRLLSAQHQAKLAEISLKLISGRISEYL